MSHTGYKVKFQRSYLGEKGFPDERPTQAMVEQIGKDAILDGHVLDGEFQGNGVVVLTGLSSSQTIDPVNILNDTERGVIIGYVPSSAYFELYRNDGNGPKVTYQFPDMFKDEVYHVFKMTIVDDNRLEVILDGADVVFTTKIPPVNDTYFVINYSVY